MNTIYYTLFAPTTGGNHIRNLISLGCDTSEEYKTTILKSYSSNSSRNIHLTDLFFNSDLEKLNSLKKLQTAKLPVSICGHFPMLVTTFDQLVNIGKLKIIVCDIPTEHAPAWLRMRVASHGIHDPYIMSEQRLLYSVETIKKISRLDDNDIIDLSTDLFHRRDIRLVIEFLSAKLNLNLPLDLCQELHTLWFDKNYNFV